MVFKLSAEVKSRLTWIVTDLWRIRQVLQGFLAIFRARSRNLVHNLSNTCSKVYVTTEFENNNKCTAFWCIIHEDLVEIFLSASERLQGRKQHIRMDVPWFTSLQHKQESGQSRLNIIMWNELFFPRCLVKSKSKSLPAKPNQTGGVIDASLWRVTTLRPMWGGCFRRLTELR